MNNSEFMTQRASQLKIYIRYLFKVLNIFLLLSSFDVFVHCIAFLKSQHIFPNVQLLEMLDDDIEVKIIKQSKSFCGRSCVL